MSELKHKIVIFSSRGSIEVSRPNDITRVMPENRKETKEFSVSSIKQRLVENKKSVRNKFRTLIRDYKKVFEQTKNEDEVKEVRELFNKDLIILLSEAVEYAEKGQTLNQVLGLTTLVPSARKLSNQLNILVRKIGKFYNQNGYMNKQMQTQFNDLFSQLITAINDAVYKNQINEDALEEDPNAVYADAPKRFSATTKFFSANVDEVLDKVDLDYDSDADENSVTVGGDGNEVANMIAFSSMQHRCKMFSSEMIPVTFVIKKTKESYADMLSDVLNLMNNKGFIGTYDPDYNYDVIPMSDGLLQYIVYMNPTKIQMNESQASNGIYQGKTLPTDYKLLYDQMSPGISNPKIDKVYKDIMDNLDDSIKVEAAYLSLDDIEREILDDKLIKTLGKDKFDALLSE